MKKIIILCCLIIASGIAFGLVFRSSSSSPQPRPDFYPLRRVSVVAEKGTFSPDIVSAKALRPISIEIISIDQNYKLESPALGIKPFTIRVNSSQKVVFTPELPGQYEFRSPQFANMVLKLDVGPCPAEADFTNPVKATTDSVELGRQIYVAACVACHGTTGKGDGPAIRSLASKPIDISQSYMKNIKDGEIFAIISDGWYGMPPFKGTLPEDGRWHVVNYLRTLSKGTN